jgi:peptide/nickel transport system permease protein
MGSYIAKRLLLLVPLLVGMSLVVFALVNVIPGDPIAILVGQNPQLPPDPRVVAQLRAQYGLDQPLHRQYLRFLANLARGDLGTSIQIQQPVLTLIVERFPATLWLATAALGLGVAIGMPTGVLSAVRPYSWVDSAALIGAMLGVAMPNFWLGLILMLLFSLYLGWLPVAGMGALSEGLGVFLAHLVMPAFTLGTGLAALLTRVTRSSMLEVMRSDYVRTARAKGLPGRAVVGHHALINALLPILTVVGVQVGYLLGGAVVVETVFAWPGIGRLAVNAIWQRDLPLIQGTVLVFALLFVLTNLIVDLLYAYVDPRVQYE